MPLHGVGLVVGGTIAVIGSGYAFKKYVYDPHLAPYIEAFLLSHPLHSLSPLSSAHWSSDRDYETSERVHRPRYAIPIPVSTGSGRSTARQPPHLTKLRRRSGRGSRSEVDYAELHEYGQEQGGRSGLLRREEREEYYLDGKGVDARVRSKPVSAKQPDIEWDENGPRKRKVSDIPPTRSTTISTNEIDRYQPLINLDTFDPPHPSGPMSPQEAEIRSVIFNYSTPAPPTRSTTPRIRLKPDSHPDIWSVGAPASLHVSPVPLTTTLPSLHHGQDGLDADASGMAESTTFSFLSLSQASSPEVPTSMLGSWAFGNGTSNHRAISPARIRRELETLPTPRSPNVPHLNHISLPSSRSTPDDHTPPSALSASDLAASSNLSMSDYIDAESYTPSSQRTTSPVLPAFPEAPRDRPSSVTRMRSPELAEMSGVADDLGLTFVRVRDLPDATELRSPGRERTVVERPMSVISMSESESGRSEDWEAV